MGHAQAPILAAGSTRWLCARLRDAPNRSRHRHRRAAHEVPRCQGVTGAGDVNHRTGDHPK